MTVIGLTGGIASGKSTVAKKLKQLGAVIVDADLIAREVVKKEEKVWHKVVEYFGQDILLPSGEIDRGALAKIIFNDDEARCNLNKITHPEILKRAEEQINYWRNMGKSPIIFDVPLLIETGAYNMVDKIWVAYCPKTTQIQRLMERNGLSQEEARSRVESQMPLEEKLRFADEVINTEGSIEETEAQVEELWLRYFKK